MQWHDCACWDPRDLGFGQAKEEKVEENREKLKESADAGKKTADEEEADHVDEEEDMEKEEPTNDKRAVERVIAVDWALSKDRWNAEKAKIDEDAVMHEVSESVEDDDRSSSESDEDSDEGRLSLHNGENEDNSSDVGSEQDEEENDEERVKPQLPHPEVGTTLFIRNIPFNATEDELRTL